MARLSLQADLGRPSRLRGFVLPDQLHLQIRSERRTQKVRRDKWEGREAGAKSFIEAIFYVFSSLLYVH